MDPSILTRLTAEAKELGFHNIGVSQVPVELRREYYKKWIESGQHGGMTWMESNNDRRLNPENLMPEAKSIIVLAMNYYQPDPERNFRVAKYALGKDYHTVILKRLKKLCRFLKENFQSEQRPYVDTGPILEKPIAQSAGLGWQGKSTILVEPKRGTWSFLANIVTSLDLPATESGKDRCGTCTRCIDDCPTKAITAPYQLDATKCISYLTIEHREAIPLEYRKAIGDRIFGCDTCLDVCPWNKWAQTSKEITFKAKELPELREILLWNEADFNHHLMASPIRRTKLRGFKRNVALVLGNIGDEKDLQSLELLAQGDDPMLQEQAEWSINEINSRVKVTFS